MLVLPVLALAPILVSATNRLPCPDGARAKERTTDEAREQWCETAAGVRHGPRRAWHRDGKQWFEGAYENGKRTGAWTFYYPSGAKRSVSQYRTDKRHGPFVEWHENGKKAMEGECRKGREEGAWVRWWPNGIKEIEVRFAAGEAKGAPQLWSRRGNRLDLDRWIGEKVRGAAPGTQRFERAKKRLGKDGGFSECGN